MRLIELVYTTSVQFLLSEPKTSNFNNMQDHHALSFQIWRYGEDHQVPYYFVRLYFVPQLVSKRSDNLWHNMVKGYGKLIICVIHL